MSDDAPPRLPLAGSERTLPEDAEALGPIDPDEPAEITVVVRRRPGGVEPHSGGALLTRAQFAAARGADPDDLARVEEFATAHGLAVASVDAARRSLVLSGNIGRLAAAFGVELAVYRSPQGEFRGRTGAVQLPEELIGVVEGVLGLDDRPQTTPHLRLCPQARLHEAAVVAFDPTEVARLYDFPTGVTGAGETIALIELGGGYHPAEIRRYFSTLGIPAPRVVPVSVDGAGNHPTGTADGPDGEVALDIEVAGAVAPGAQLAVYFAPNTDRGFIDALTTAVHDAVRAPSVVSISWGSAEAGWTRQAMLLFDAACADAAAMGVTVCCASGDDGSADRVGDGRAHADFPASSPHVLGCGGTHLTVRAGAIVEETAWHDSGGGSTGGGVSDVFAVPPWQESAGVPPSANPGGRHGRGVPDVSGVADPASGYRVLVDGRLAVVGGTSAVAPLWAGLVALCNEALGRPVGFLNPQLYGSLAQRAFRDITTGSNGAYSAAPGWDACTGLGSPRGSLLLTGLRDAAVAAAR